ncbi:4-hydroxy-tetrahydrodipicolinate reductase [Glaciecola sp. 1036]|uniref:4-hydroxy-tetrahydrodipicolinate reductase n=1 Tax=Alteromonadaceae TaxID=72275 RepID=UPI003D015150
MVKVGILGANGRMGRVLIEAAYAHSSVALGFASVRSNSPFIGMDAGELAGISRQYIKVVELKKDIITHADVLIDFTLPEALEQNLHLAVDSKTPIVIGTTGLTSEQLTLIDEAAKYIPVVFAANYSVGVNLMLNLVKTAAKVMGDTADIEILEAHHRFKKDAPSGTAMAIGQSIADALDRNLDQCAVYGREGVTEERSRETIGFATVRAGDIVGEHTAMFATLGERLEITHKASSRLTFANGALHAAQWLKGKEKGLFSMQNVLELL